MQLRICWRTTDRVELKWAFGSAKAGKADLHGVIKCSSKFLRRAIVMGVKFKYDSTHLDEKRRNQTRT